MIEYRGPFKCAKCGREIPQDRDCPRCESGPWWPVLLAFFACGAAIGGIVYMAVHPRIKPVPVMAEVKYDPISFFAGEAKVTLDSVGVFRGTSDFVKSVEIDGVRVWPKEKSKYSCTEDNCIQSSPSGGISAKEFVGSSASGITLTPADELPDLGDPLFPVVVIKGHNKTTVLVPKP